MNRRVFFRLAGGGVVFAAFPILTGCSNEIPPEAVAAWMGPRRRPMYANGFWATPFLRPLSHPAILAGRLSMLPISQALQEYPKMARPYTEVHQLLEAAQAWAAFVDAIESNSLQQDCPRQ